MSSLGKYNTKLRNLMNNIPDEDEIYKICNELSPKNEEYIDMTSLGRNFMNSKKNRYYNVLPSNEDRVILSNDTYINASYIDDAIATQGPLSETVEDFYQMIWEKRVKVVVMLCNLIENGRSKCCKYYPELSWRCHSFMDENNEQKSTNIHGKYEVTLENLEMKTFCILRTLKLRKFGENEERIIYQLHYRDWVDHGVPNSAINLFDTMELADELNNEKTPFLVHCSAGIGRTGTYLVIRHILKLLIEVKLSGGNIMDVNFNVVEIILSFRRSRGGMVQTREQIRFIYEAIIEAIKYKKLFKKNIEIDEDNFLSNSNKRVLIQLNSFGIIREDIHYFDEYGIGEENIEAILNSSCGFESNSLSSSSNSKTEFVI